MIKIHCNYERLKTIYNLLSNIPCNHQICIGTTRPSIFGGANIGKYNNRI